MKVFWDAGLKEITKDVHKSASAKIQIRSIFKRMHRLILQVYEALYLLQIKAFLQHRQCLDEHDQSNKCQFSSDVVLEKITEVVNTLKMSENDGNVCLDHETITRFFKGRMISFHL